VKVQQFLEQGPFWLTGEKNCFNKAWHSRQKVLNEFVMDKPGRFLKYYMILLELTNKPEPGRPLLEIRSTEHHLARCA
jgi:hypothetical protein